MEDISIREGSLDEIMDVRSQIPEFDLPFDKNYFENRYKGKDNLLLIAEYLGTKVGFIVAYDRDRDGSFYCWMAGVSPEYRKHGVFSELMEYLNQWARNNGYNKMKVKTHNNFRQMLMYLVKNGFNFTLIEAEENILDNAIHLEKQL